MDTDHAAIEETLREVDRTLIAAASPPSPWSGDAERFLRGVASRARSLEDRIRDRRAEVEAQRERQRAEERRCDTALARHQDLVDESFAGPSTKPLVMELVARELDETDPLSARTLRCLAADLGGVNGALLAARAELTVLEAQRRATARHGRLQLTRLERWWRASGLSDSAVRAMMPDRRQSSSIAV